jgi:hypothetical protein
VLLMRESSTGVSADLQLSTAEEDFLQLLEGLDGPEQQQQPVEATSRHGMLQQPPWRPPGTTPSISSPPPPVIAERGSSSSSRVRQQEHKRRRASPPRVAAVSAAAVGSAAHVGGQQQQQPISYQRQLQAYLDTQHEQPHPDSDQQRTDQQHGKHWPHQSSRSPKGHGSSPKAPSSSTKTAAAVAAVGDGLGTRSSKVVAHSSSKWSPQQQQQQQLRYRLSLPESCDGSDIEVDWAAAALEAAAAGAPATAAGAFEHTQPAAAVVEDPDAVVEEFAAMLEVGQCQQRWDAAAAADQAASGVVDQTHLMAWGSRVDAGWLNSSSNSGSNRGVAGLGPCSQQQQLGVRVASQLAPGGLQEGSQSEQELQELRTAINATLRETAAAFRRYSLLRRAFSGWSSVYVPAARSRSLRRDASAAAADAFAAARQHRLLSHCWSGWTAAVLVGGSARSAGTQLLQRCVRRQVLADWRGVVLGSREVKQQVLRAWNAQVQEHQVRDDSGLTGTTACSTGTGRAAIHPA